jgi:hypothetical protein
MLFIAGRTARIVGRLLVIHRLRFYLVVALGQFALRVEERSGKSPVPPT